MGLATFKGGIHPYEGKELSENKPVQVLEPKGELVYPMSQHIGAPAKPLVAVEMCIRDRPGPFFRFGDGPDDRGPAAGRDQNPPAGGAQRSQAAADRPEVRQGRNQGQL